MKSRDIILEEISRLSKIECDTKSKRIELEKQLLMLYDEHTQYIEKPENGVLVGRMYWTEKFKDEDGEYVDVQRSQILRRDRQWICEFR